MNIKIANGASRIAQRYATIPSVEAVVLGGSQVMGDAHPDSDIDFYVYSRQPIPLTTREQIARAQNPRAEVGNQFWEPGDEWVDLQMHTGVDVMFRSVEWIETQLDRVLKRFEASVGYSTCFWHNVLYSDVLFDRNGWFTNLQTTAHLPYPPELVHAIMAKNYPILRTNQSSYLAQMKKAIERKDRVSITHRVAALFASYFDILFAVNRTPHPGEKRQLQWLLEKCSHRPQNVEEDVCSVIRAIGQDGANLVGCVIRLLDRLDLLLVNLGFGSHASVTGRPTENSETVP